MSTSKKSTKRVPFPERLFHLLKLAEESGWEDIISWVDDGTGFKVHDRVKFEELLLVKYFNTTRYASFTRQLHAYDFDCVRTGRQTGIYSHPGFTRDNPEASCSLKREASKLNSKKAISTVSKNKNKVQGIPAVSFQQGMRAGDTIVQFPTLLRPSNVEEDNSSTTSTSDTSSDTQSPIVTGLYKTVRSQVADQTRRALIRIPPQASDNPFNNPDKAFWSLATSREPTVSKVASPPTVARNEPEQCRQFRPSRRLPVWSSPTFTNNMDNASPATESSELLKLYGLSSTYGNAFDPVPLAEKAGNDEDILDLDPIPWSPEHASIDDDEDTLDLEPIPWSPEHASPDDDDEGQGMSMDQSNQLDSILEPRTIQDMVQNPQRHENEWWYDSAPMFGTPRKRAVLEFSLPLSLPLGFYLMDVSKFGIYWVIFLVGGHFVECLFTDWGGSKDKNDKSYTKDLNIKPEIGMLQHHVLDLLWFHFLLSNMMLTPQYFGPPCFPLLYLFMWPQPINLAIVIKTHYCESDLEGTYAHDKYWLGDIIKKSIMGYAMTMLGVIPMHLLEMNYLRVPLVFGFNMIPLWAFESYRCLLSMSAVNGTAPEKLKVD